ncbi:MAG: FGGY-family carbohydrate kinase [Spirochaetales bacterium]|uniref:FGGY-family carbohydrate kinase n=1 Tax=Candidatus Thalassospirochaeta sargassi TaxID=3119039 RepID=A0AAJ1IIT2_9SPIO|nr:FGGY-family carbohydrate kinase [Spirochaetales bacterium]
MEIIDYINSGETFLGIELGSTRIKAVLTKPDGTPIAGGGHSWENSQVDGIWTYPLEEVIEGIQACYTDLKNTIRKEYGLNLKRFRAGGISAMMHGYIAFDADGKLLVPFRTWRNNITAEASAALSELFNYPIPQRWSIAHLYQAILNGEAHTTEISSITTLAGWMHRKLTGTNVLGIGDASGMFPIDTNTANYNSSMLKAFDEKVSEKGFGWKLAELFPEVLPAGVSGGILTAEGALLLDPSGDLESGITFCPPEGDAGTGMVATNSVRQRTGNVSAGTSVFAMIVLERELSKTHEEIDLITTPDGSLVGMAHSNNCSTEYSAWIELFGEAAKALGADIDPANLYDSMMKLALTGDSDCGGLLAYGYHSGEHMTGFTEGRPLLVRRPGDSFTPANIIRAQLFTSLCALRTGLDILTGQENVTVDEIKGHGGFFKTPGVGERIMAAALNTPISVLSTAGEGGAWGIALLAGFIERENKSLSLPDYLDGIFAAGAGRTATPDRSDVEGFQKFFERYHEGLAIERAAVENLK